MKSDTLNCGCTLIEIKSNGYNYCSDCQYDNCIVKKPKNKTTGTCHLCGKDNCDRG